MPEIAVTALEPRLQKLVESARAAFAAGRPESAVEAAAAVLREQPSCLPVRKLLRAAQLRQAGEKSGFGRFMANVSSAPFVLGGSRQLKEQPLAAVASADKLLLRDADSVPALALLGEAAAVLGWPETAVFACETAAGLEPDRPALLLALGEALLAAGRAPDAVKAAQRVLAGHPNHTEAQALLRNASVAVTMAKGKWEQGGDYRGKLHDEQKAAQLEQAARLAPRPPPQP
jgi:tetratricopeptide (TPR) repeat protein